jgi:penicillin-binding protein 1A
MANSTNGKNVTKTKTKSNIKKTNKKSKKKNPVLRFLKIFFISLISIIILSSVAAFGVIMAMIKTAPPLDVNGTILNLSQPSVLYDDSGQVMDTVITAQKRTVVSIKNVPANLPHAFVSIEDERFYQHGGIDIRRIISSAFEDVLNKIHKTGNIQGASTITQELIKQRMFLNDSLTNRIDFKRKVQEAYLAVELEKVLTKDQILEAYMNTIFLGGQANGIEAASEQYFNKNVKDLNLVQCAFIAGLAQSPSAYYPFSTANEKDHSSYINRTKTVLDKMYQNGYINSTDYKNALKDASNNNFGFSQNTKNNDNYNFPWFSTYAVDQVKAGLKAQYGYTDEQVNSLILNGGLKIYTTMNRSLENSAQAIINNNNSYGETLTDKSGIVEPQASATLIDYHTGQIKVIIGGRGNQPPGSWNRAVTTGDVKPVGSSIKPLTVYSPAIENKIVTATTTVLDGPFDAAFENKYNGYNPTDDGGGYEAPGMQTIATALTRSINVIAVKVEDEVGLSTGASYADKFGLKLSSADKNSIAALSLGQISGSNTLTMAAAYGVFGNNGMYVSPIAYTKVVDDKGTVLLQSSFNTRKVISPQTAYVMYNLLKGPIDDPSGTGTNANIGDMPVAGKTGTTTDSLNLWFCGLSPYYSAAVWMGDDEPHPRTLSSMGDNSNTTAGIWGQIMKVASKGQQVKDLTPPEGVTSMNNEYYIDGTAPVATTSSTTTTNTNSAPPQANNTTNTTPPANNTTQATTPPANNTTTPSNNASTTNNTNNTNTTTPSNNSTPTK